MSELRRRLLERLASVKEGATMCPGKLSRECDTNLAAARSDLMELARAGKIVLRQGGKRVKPGKLKGPFRVALK